MHLFLLYNDFYFFCSHFHSYYFSSFFLRFLGGDILYKTLFKIYLDMKEGDAALELLKNWNDKKFSKLPKEAFEILLDEFVVRKKNLSALNVIKLYQENDGNRIDLEIRLLLDNNDIDSILNIFREAAILKMVISENVCIIVARKIFEIIRIETQNIEDIENKYLNNVKNNNIDDYKNNDINNNIIKNDIDNNGSDNDIIYNDNNNNNNNNINNNDNIITNKMNDYDQGLINISKSICKNRLLDIEEISNNLLYCERGSSKVFCRNIRIWREGGEAFKLKSEVCLSIFVSVSLSVCPSVCLSICLFICVSVYLSVCLCACLSVCLYFSLCFSLSVCLSVYLSVCVIGCVNVCGTYNYLYICVNVFVRECLYSYVCFLRW